MEYFANNTAVAPAPKPRVLSDDEIKKKELEDHRQLLSQFNYKLIRSYPHIFQFASWKDFNYWFNVSTNTRTLKFVTYNIWFADFHSQVRWQGLANIVRDQDPDFICFQEVTKQFLEVLVAQPWVRERYITSDAIGNTFQSYGVIILSKYPCRKFELHQFPSTMGRSLLIGHFYINGEDLAVATSHLESMDNGRIRRSQLIITEDFLRQYPNAFFMGDFNIDATSNYNDQKQITLENNNLKYFMPEYIDTWQQLHPELKGYTFDTDNNAMIANNSKEITRYDRIMYKSKNWAPMSIQIIGDKEITRVGHHPILPSDHYGLVAQFQFKAGHW